MKICVLGLGYVGVVSAACLAQEGHRVIGVDPEAIKVDIINAGWTPVVEQKIGNIIKEQVAAGRLSATTDAAAAIPFADLLFICVGTPSLANGGLDMRCVRRACEQIGEVLRQQETAPVVVVRSALLPGTMRQLVIPALEAASGKLAGADFGVCINPEFLREGTAVYDYYHPPKTVIGELGKSSGDILASLYARRPGPVIRTDIETAELVKYADNAWHALKIGFANEIGNICKAINIDAHRVMDIFCQDTKLNISSTYLKPGFAFGGSCLPKDLRALLDKADKLDLTLPILGAILASNQLQIERSLRTVVRQGKRRIGILGFSFKAGTDDLRESPVVELAERLIGKGYELRMYDRNVRMANLHGSNRDYIINHIPHLSRLMLPSIDAVLAHADTLIIGNAEPEFLNIAGRLRHGQNVIDLVRISDSRSVDGVYEGLCW
ncbi:MAG: nucleotide sugar dehydrogenase [Bacteroidota bacterium]